jgi:hypothetical protein
LAVGVHTTQFEIHHPEINLYQPVLAQAAAVIDASLKKTPRPFVKIAGICGLTASALREAALAQTLGYDAGLLSLAAWPQASVAELIDHSRAGAEILPVIGFYLQPNVGGRVLPLEFWRKFAEIENVVAIKIAPFNRYQTFDVVRAVCETGRDRDIALYTGNDDHIVLDLLSKHRIQTVSGPKTVEIVGGLLGHWAVWTQTAVTLFDQLKQIRRSGAVIPPEILTRAVEVTDANAVFFDAAHQFHGCIPGLHEVLRRQGLLEEIGCLTATTGLSPGQAEEIDRVYRSYPHLHDDDFVARHRDEWLQT